MCSDDVALRILDEECNRVANAVPGMRNNTAFTASAAMGNLIAGGELVLQVAAEALLEAARLSGLPDREAEAVVANGLEVGMSTPRTLRTQGGVMTAYPSDRIRDLAEQHRQAAASQNGKPAFPVYTTAELRSIPPPEYLVDGFLVKGALNSLFGPFDSYKSFIAIDWTLTIAAGLGSWFGHATKTGPVVYVAGEGGSGLWQRVEAWADHRRCEPPDVYWIAGAVNMYRESEAAGLLAWIMALPELPVLVVFDTTSRCAVGADENSARDMGIVIANMDTIRSSGAAVLAIHHTGHEQRGRERGSSGIPGAADGRIRVQSDQTLTAMVEPVKMKDAEKGELIRVHLEPRLRSLVIGRAGTRIEARESTIREAIINYLASHPKASQTMVEDNVRYQRDAVRAELKALVNAGIVVREDAPRSGYEHSLATPPEPWGGVGRGGPGTPETTPPDARRPKAGGVVEPQSTPPENSGRGHARDQLEDGGW